jgi:DNA-binding NarL/FixJ family response regulator
LARRYRDSLDERAELSGRLLASQVEGARWRAAARQASEGLKEAIRGQFADWRLSPSEADVAMLMLKGLSHKEVARLRQASPATVRQQATAVYQKSGLGSRAALAAFFLEDLFPAGMPQQMS